MRLLFSLAFKHGSDSKFTCLVEIAGDYLNQYPEGNQTVKLLTEFEHQLLDKLDSQAQRIDTEEAWLYCPGFLRRCKVSDQTTRMALIYFLSQERHLAIAETIYLGIQDGLGDMEKEYAEIFVDKYLKKDRFDDALSIIFKQLDAGTFLRRLLAKVVNNGNLDQAARLTVELLKIGNLKLVERSTIIECFEAQKFENVVEIVTALESRDSTLEEEAKEGGSKPYLGINKIFFELTIDEYICSVPSEAKDRAEVLKKHFPRYSDYISCVYNANFGSMDPSEIEKMIADYPSPALMLQLVKFYLRNKDYKNAERVFKACDYVMLVDNLPIEIFKDHKEEDVADVVAIWHKGLLEPMFMKFDPYFMNNLKSFLESQSRRAPYKETYWRTCVDVFSTKGYFDLAKIAAGKITSKDVRKACNLMIGQAFREQVGI